MVDRKLLSNRDQAGVNHAITGGVVHVVPHIVPAAALGDHVLRQAFVSALQHGFVIAAQHILTDFTGQHDAVVSIVQSAVAILFFGGVWHRVVDTEFGPRARPWLPARVA